MWNRVGLCLLLIRTGCTNSVDECTIVTDDGTGNNITEAAFQSVAKALDDADYEQLDRYFDCGFDVNTVLDIRSGPSLISHAAETGNGEAMDYLIRKGGNLDLQNGDGETPLMISVRNSNRILATQLLTAGANKAIRDKFGQTAHDSAEESKLDIPNLEAYKRAKDY